MATASMFTETDYTPPGRTRRVVSDQLWAALERSAKKLNGFYFTGKPDEVKDLRSDLTSAAVKAKYEVTTEAEELDDGTVRLTVSARPRPVPAPPAAQ